MNAVALLAPPAPPNTRIMKTVCGYIQCPFPPSHRLYELWWTALFTPVTTAHTPQTISQQKAERRP